MNTFYFQSLCFIITLFCISSVFGQSGWVSAHKKDDIEAFYQFEKSGSDTLDVEAKVTNRRAKSIEVLVKITSTDKPKSYGTPDNPTLRKSSYNYIKLMVKANETSVSKRIEIEGLKISKVEIECWKNVDSQSKCDIPSNRRRINGN